jgi:D-alanyl-D-alanine carboxypeptidase
MLWRGFSGIKTGITPNAGPCLSASVKKTIDGKEYEFVMILLKSFSMETRWKEVEGLAEWACEIIKK